MTQAVGVCSAWAVQADVPEAWAEGIESTTLDTCLLAATQILFPLSGSQYPGSCTDTVRPCASRPGDDPGRPIRNGGLGGWAGAGGMWWGFSDATPWGMCGCNRSVRTGCNSAPEITLGAYPVTAITEVLIDGGVVDPATYEIRDHRYLVRLAAADGVNDGWPCCQRLDLATTETGTFQVTFTFGMIPEQAGVIACCELATQLAYSMTPTCEDRCLLPQRVTQVTRQGVTHVILDPMAFLDAGKTGLYWCDLFLKGKNPGGKVTRRATVMSPDVRRSVTRAT